jgi:hypothetical protein
VIVAVAAVTVCCQFIITFCLLGVALTADAALQTAGVQLLLKTETRPSKTQPNPTHLSSPQFANFWPFLITAPNTSKIKSLTMHFFKYMVS